MRIDLEFVELHTPLFLDGINFGLKLYSNSKKNKAPITMWYDTELKHTVVVCKDKVALIETTASMTLFNPKQIGLAIASAHKEVVNQTWAQTSTAAVRAQVSGPGIGLKQTAQVSTPLDKVQGTPGRKAKYQGEESQGE